MLNRVAMSDSNPSPDRGLELWELPASFHLMGVAWQLETPTSCTQRWGQMCGCCSDTRKWVSNACSWLVAWPVIAGAENLKSPRFGTVGIGLTQTGMSPWFVRLDWMLPIYRPCRFPHQEFFSSDLHRNVFAITLLPGPLEKHVVSQIGVLETLITAALLYHSICT
jgi:hypothetical protein